jgi:hypothetical protein
MREVAWVCLLVVMCVCAASSQSDTQINSYGVSCSIDGQPTSLEQCNKATGTNWGGMYLTMGATCINGTFLNPRVNPTVGINGPCQYSYYIEADGHKYTTDWTDSCGVERHTDELEADGAIFIPSLMQAPIWSEYEVKDCEGAHEVDKPAPLEPC